MNQIINGAVFLFQFALATYEAAALHNDGLALVFVIAGSATYIVSTMERKMS